MELFIRHRKLNISPAFIKKSYLKVSKDLRLNITSQTKSFRQNLIKLIKYNTYKKN